MTKNLLSSAVLAGLIAGGIAALLQFLFVIPLLLEGELYESGQRIHFATDGSTESDRGAPSLGGEWGRHLMTVAFNLVTYTAYGLLLCAGMLFARDMRGGNISATTGLLWGLGGFIAVQLAPAMGLPPELPGTPAAEVDARQIWWISTILLTTLGLGLIAFGRGLVWHIAGLVVILAPQLWGAPHLDAYYGVSPPELSAEFATISLSVAAIGWSVLGYFCGYFVSKGDEDS